MKIDCIKTALIDGIGIASIAFGCTPQTHLLGVAIRTPKTPKGKDGYHGKKNRKNQVLADR